MGSLSFSSLLVKGRMTQWLLFILLFTLSGFGTLSISQSGEEEFSEELLLRPLPDGKVLAHFHFTNKLPQINSYGHHHRLFPKAIYQLVQKFRIQEMEISFTQGRWNYDHWGGMDPVVRSNAKPSGVELWAVFGVPDDQIDATWRNLTHALSGLFCSSLNFLESPAMIANPVRTFRPDLNANDLASCDLEGAFNYEQTTGPTSDQQQPCPDHIYSSCSLSGPTSVKGTFMKGGKRKYLGRVRYGALPREAVCTENLTPWLKLLPCRDKAGFTTLLDRPVIYKGWYHSLRLHVRSGEFEPHAIDGHKGTLLQQTLTLVIEPSQVRKTVGSKAGPNRRRMQPDWSVSSLFGRDLATGCPLAKSSVVYLEFERTLVKKLEQLDVAGQWQDMSALCTGQGNGDSVSDGIQQAQDGLTKTQETCTADAQKKGSSRLELNFVENDAYVLRLAPQIVFREVEGSEKTTGCEGCSSVLLAFEVGKHEDSLPLDVGISWKIPLAWAPIQGPFRATRFLVGSGNARGAIAIALKTNQWQVKRSSVDISELEIKELTPGGSHSEHVIDVMIFQIVPWYVRLYLHTLQVFIDEQPKPLSEVIKWMQVFPSEDRRSPGVIEMELRIPYNATTITLITEFDKGFLRIDEHPPDANRGFDLPSALISFPYQRSERQYRRITNSTTVDDKDSPLLQDYLKEKPVQVYTEVLLVPLATPDFSMPYNVITLTCTVLALYFGSLLNILRRRVGEEERLANSRELSPLGKLEQLLNKLIGWRKGRNKDSPPSKGLRLFKILFVVVIAVAVNYYFANR